MNLNFDIANNFYAETFASTAATCFIKF